MVAVLPPGGEDDGVMTQIMVARWWGAQPQVAPPRAQ